MSDNGNGEEAGWWEGPEGHRFALEVLQLSMRRQMLQLIAGGKKDVRKVGAELNLTPTQVEYHLSMLEKALVIERTGEGWRATAVGLLFLETQEVGP
ncbi:MAG: ArsR family transcriptional regulator [Methanothrix sp.]